MSNKFTKLNLGDTVASGGGRVFKKLSTVAIPTEQLPPPYAVTIDGNTLTWGDYSALATSFDILVDGVAKATVSAPTNSFDLSTLGLASGTYSISVVSKAEGYLDSEPSEAVTYTVGGDELAGTWVFNSTLTDMGSTGSTESWEVSFSTSAQSYAILKKAYEATFSQNQGLYFDTTLVWDAVNEWHSNTYKTITITSTLSQVIDGNYLLTWLKANATKQ